MKSIFKSLIFAIAAIAASSCVKASIDPLTGMYAAPVVVENASLSNVDVQKADKNRVITVKLASSAGDVQIQFLSSKPFLKAESYSPAPADFAKADKNYIIENTTVAGNNIDFGVITVGLEGDTHYSISGVLQSGENLRYKLAWKGEIVFEAEPEPDKLVKVLSAQSNLTSGTQSVTMQLASEGVFSSFDMSTFSTIYTGNGYFAAIDLYSADGYLHEGVYTPCAQGGVIAEGQYGIGWDPGDIWGIGIPFTNWGTCWWKVDNGSTSATHITSGNIVVTKVGGKWKIEYEDYVATRTWFVFEGAIPAITDESEGGDIDIELTALAGAQSNVASGTKSVTLKFTSEGLTATYNPATWGYDFAGTGSFISIDIYSEDGTLAEGTYTPCATGGSIGEGEFGIGYDVDFFGMQMIWGTTIQAINEGAAGEIAKVLDGTITVAKSGDVYTITQEGGSTPSFQYVGQISIQ